MWGELFSAVGHAVLPVVGTVAGGLVAMLAQKQLKKVGLEVGAAQQQRIRQVVYDAVTRTEEVARRDMDMTSADKADYAERIVLERAPDIPPSTVRHFIDVALPSLRRQGIAIQQPKPVSLPAELAGK